MTAIRRRIENAIDRVEYAAAELRQAAILYAHADRTGWSGVSRDKELTAAARKYAAAQNAFRRIR